MLKFLVPVSLIAFALTSVKCSPMKRSIHDVATLGANLLATGTKMENHPVKQEAKPLFSLLGLQVPIPLQLLRKIYHNHMNSTGYMENRKPGDSFNSNNVDMPNKKLPHIQNEETPEIWKHDDMKDASTINNPFSTLTQSIHKFWADIINGDENFTTPTSELTTDFDSEDGDLLSRAGLPPQVVATLVG